MSPISVKSVLKSGLIAGILINISAISMVPAVGNQMTEVLASRGLPPMTNYSYLYFSGVSLIFGIFLMFLFALLKPVFASAWKAGVVSTLLLWFIAYVLSNVSLWVYGFMPARLVLIGTVWGLGELCVAVFAGSKFYREHVYVKT